jgi:hypothetical protein
MRGAKRKTCLALLGVLGVFGSGAYSVYAVVTPGGRPGVATPSITAKPAKRTWRTSARFAFTDRWHRVSFQCSLDESRFESCASPTRYPGLLAGGWHTFRVRALGSYPRRELSSPASYTWLVDLQPPVPYIARHPTDPTTSTGATLAFTDGEPHVRFKCRVDTGAWRVCASPVSYRGLSVGEHHFRVRAIDPPGRHSPVARFDWRVVTQLSGETLPNGAAQPSGETPPSGESFSISGEIVGGLLYPGAAPEAIRITLANPNDVLIFVTNLTVTVPSGPAGCDSAANISLAQSNVSSTAPVEIQAHGLVTLPAQGRFAPTIQLVNLPVNQDACQNARFSLSFTGSAHS